MIVRKAKHERDYIVVSRHTLEDPELGVKARGLLAFLLAKPDDWQIHVRPLAKSLRIGKNTAAGILTELQQAGYVDKRRMHDSRGRLSGFEYVVYEERQSEPRRRQPHVTTGDTAPLEGGRTTSRKAGHGTANCTTSQEPSAGEKVHTKYPLNQEISAGGPASPTIEKEPGYAASVRLLFQLHLQRTGAKYVFTQADGANLKRLLRTLGAHALAAKLRDYYTGQHWFSRKDGYSFRHFTAHVNALSVGALNAGDVSPLLTCPDCGVQYPAGLRCPACRPAEVTCAAP